MFRALLLWSLAAWAGAAQAAGMGAADARRLLERTGFDAAPAEVAQFSQLTRTQGVDRILAGTHRTARTPLPPEVLEWTDPRTLRGMSPEERKAFQQDLRRRALALKGWWLDEMVTTDSPLTERMTLFWHNHFTSSLQKVRSPALMARQNALLRRYALGNFGALLHAVAKDPAMLVYLDGARNRKGHPNENFAREVMELFTLGEGHYGESDVREAARAYTGWSIDPADGSYRWRPFMHDRGVKTVLGQSGDFDGDQVLDILLAQPATAEFVTAKLWREFVSPQPDARELERVASDFRASGYEIRVALRELLLSDAFWAPANRDALVKSPVDLVVGTVRRYGIRYDDSRPLVFALHQLGQDLFSPPDVRGWPGGDEWITTQTLLARKQFLARVFRGEQARMMSPMAMAANVLAPEYQLK
ncbi:MAG TPA: DUF1800 domain-containing protein [Burkholderiales bacterium]|nr:DUF1800 domain-containing protein [Burkholderiales bacterium]